VLVGAATSSPTGNDGAVWRSDAAAVAYLSGLLRRLPGIAPADTAAPEALLPDAGLRPILNLTKRQPHP
jgi:hypothetical protein